MKFTIEANQLKQVLSRMVNVTERRATIPITQNVLMRVYDKLTLQATDLDTQLKEGIYCETSEAGETTVNAAMLKAIIDKLPDGNVSLHVKDEVLHIKSGKSNFKLNTLPASDFPVLASDEFTAVVPFDGSQLKSALDRTIWAVSKEETRYMLNGIAMQHFEGNAIFVATDGHRLSKYEVQTDTQFPDVIIPTKTAKLFSSVVSDKAELHVSKTKVKLVTGDIELLSKVVDATYANWRGVLTHTYTDHVTASSMDLKSSVDRVQTVMDERTKIVSIHIDSDGITIKGGNGNNHATDSIEANKSGNDVVIGVNGRYALEALAQADKGDVKISYITPMDPMLITYEKEPNMVALLMPARI